MIESLKDSQRLTPIQAATMLIDGLASYMLSAGHEALEYSGYTLELSQLMKAKIGLLHGDPAEALETLKQLMLIEKAKLDNELTIRNPAGEGRKTPDEANNGLTIRQIYDALGKK